RNLDFRDYLRARLPRPPTGEQEAIAGVLSAAELAVRSAEGELEAARRANASLLQELFTRGVPGRHSAYRRVEVLRHRVGIPQAWAFERLGGLLQRVEYGTNAPSHSHSEGYPVIAIPQVVDPVLVRKDWPYVNISAREADQLRL